MLGGDSCLLELAYARANLGNRCQFVLLSMCTTVRVRTHQILMMTMIISVVPTSRLNSTALIPHQFSKSPINRADMISFLPGAYHRPQSHGRSTLQLEANTPWYFCADKAAVKKQVEPMKISQAPI